MHLKRIFQSYNAAQGIVINDIGIINMKYDMINKQHKKD